MLKEHSRQRRGGSWCRTATCAPPTSAARLGQPTTRMEDGRLRRDRQGGAAERRDRFSLGPGRPRRRRATGTWRRRTRSTATRSSSGCRARRRRRPARDRAGRLPVLRRHRERAFPATTRRTTCCCARCPCERVTLGKDGAQREVLVATVFDLQAAHYGVARGLAGEHAATSYDDDTPYTPAWQERITGTPRDSVITVAREFADNADKTARPVDGDHRRRHESLVSQRHELPRHHQHADDVRLHRQERRRLVALRGPGKAAPADRLDRARVRARLDAPAAPDELDQLLLRRTPISGATRSWAWRRCSRRSRDKASSTAAP